MLIAILILTIFNIGLTILLGLGGLALMKQEMCNIAAIAMKHTDGSIEAATTALFNKESLKQKAEMSGEVEV